MQQQNNLNQMGHIPQDKLQGMAQGIQQNQNLPPGVYPNQPMQGNFPPTQFPPQQQQPQQRSNVAPVSDMPTLPRGPSIASGAAPVNNGNVSPMNPGGTTIAQNPAASPTDAMVNRLAEAERAVKDERRSQWLSMNQSPASSVLANLGGGELPSHLRGGNEANNPAAEIMAAGIGQTSADAPNDALLRRISEVAIRRVARKRGVAVEAPQTKLNDGLFEVNVTYVDDGRVLDTPEDLTQAFEHAIQTELALKGYDLTCAVSMFRSKDGKTEKIGAEPEEDMFACEICDGLVKDSDPTCPHCGAVFEEEEEEPETQASPTRSGPPGPKKSGGPPGPKKSGGPPGPKKSGGPPGPKKSGGPPGPKKSGGPPGPKKSGGPPGPKKSGGPPGPKKSGGPPGGPKKGGGPPVQRRAAVLLAVQRRAAVLPVQRRAAALLVVQRRAAALLVVQSAVRLADRVSLNGKLRIW